MREITKNNRAYGRNDNTINFATPLVPNTNVYEAGANQAYGQAVSAVGGNNSTSVSAPSSRTMFQKLDLGFFSLLVSNISLHQKAKSWI